MNVLLISYHFEPFLGVGAKRLTYWAKAFWSDPAFKGKCTVVTATRQTQPRNHVHFIEDRKDSLLEKALHGYSWMKPLRTFIESSITEVDVVIISGGPFGHFPIQHFLKKRFACKVILDLRDPMASNPRFGTSYLKDFFKRQFEKMMLRAADEIVTVNPCCVDLIPLSIPRTKISIIENGYDETIVDMVPADKFTDGNYHVIHAGKFYEDPTPFVRELFAFNSRTDGPRFIFHHVGDRDERLVQFTEPFMVQHHERPYLETIQLMKRCTIGFLVTKPGLLEFNTKVFDYVGCDLDIFLVIDGRPEDVCLYRLTSRLGGKTYWMQPTADSINDVFQSYKDRRTVFLNKEACTRRFGYENLKKIMGRRRSVSKGGVGQK